MKGLLTGKVRRTFFAKGIDAFLEIFGASSCALEIAFAVKLIAEICFEKNPMETLFMEIVGIGPPRVLRTPATKPIFVFFDRQICFSGMF